MSADAHKPSVGIVGVGGMGLAIAAKLISEGFETIGFRRSSLDEFQRMGGIPCGSAAEVTGAADVVLFLLPDDLALIDTLHLVSPELRKGQLLICLASHPIAIKMEASHIARAAGAVFLDGEISGTPEMLRSGAATIFLAGDEEARIRALPVLDCFAKCVEQCAQFGDAVKLKLLANYLVGVNTLAVADALAMAERMNLQLEDTVRVLGRSAGASRMMDVRGPMIARGEVGAGDLSAFMKFFRGLRQETRGGSDLLHFVEAFYARTVAQGAADCDLAAVGQLLRHRSTGRT